MKQLGHKPGRLCASTMYVELISGRLLFLNSLIASPFLAALA